MQSQKPSLKKVFLITHEFYPTLRGISVFLQEIAKCATRMGYQIVVWAPGNDALRNATFPYRVKALDLKGTQSWLSRIKLGIELFRSRHQFHDAILYLAEPGPVRTMLYLQLFSVIKPKALWITLYGSEIKKFTFLPYRKFLFKKLLNSADRVSVISQYNREFLSQIFPNLKPNITITGGALKSDYSPAKIQKKEKSGDKIIVLTVGGIHPRKGQLDLLSAMNGLELELKNIIEYWIVGPIIKRSYLKRIQAYAENNKLKFKYLGVVDNKELSELYLEADIYAMTSIDYRSSVEGFGLTYLEASAHRLPIIAHRVGGVEDAVKDNVTGILVDPGDKEKLTAAIKLLAENKSLRKKLGEAGVHWAENQRWEDCVENIFGES